jgi:hypothetical protein
MLAMALIVTLFAAMLDASSRNSPARRSPAPSGVQRLFARLEKSHSPLPSFGTSCLIPHGLALNVLLRAFQAGKIRLDRFAYP